MKKRVVLINDELGTMALGFSKAGYDINAICIGQTDKIALRVLKDNWGALVRSVDLEFYNYHEMVTDLDVECVAGRLLFDFSVAARGYRGENRTVLQVVRLLEEKKPKCFLFQ